MSSDHIWYNYWQPDYTSDKSGFYESKDFDWAQELIANFDTIKEELMAVVDKRDGQLKAHYAKNVNADVREWSTLAFKTWGIQAKQNLQEVPFISNWLANHQNVLSSSLNILGPGANIGEHLGDTDAILRCHLGIEIPCGLPKLGFEVNGETRPWIEGDFIIFRDALPHRGWNDSEYRRIIFVIDVLEDQFTSRKVPISINVRAFQLLQWFVNGWTWSKKWPKWMHKIIFFKFKILLYILYPIQKNIGVIKKH